MYKFKPKEAWYKDALAKEDAAGDIAAGFEVINLQAPTEEAADESECVEKAYDVLRMGFSLLMRKLRANKELSIKELASRIDVEPRELYLIEYQMGYKPPLRTIMQLSNFYGIPYKNLVQIAGVVRHIDRRLQDDVVRYAANADTFEKLTKEEKRDLNSIIKELQKVGD